MLVVSVGTGTSPDVRNGLEADDMNLLFNATSIPSALMFAALNEQDLLCRVFGSCQAGDPLDRELGPVCPGAGPLPADGKLFTYVRYNAELTRAGLDELNCHDIVPSRVQRLDSLEAVPELRAIGQAVAAQRVDPSLFSRFPI
jgi:hypothetical protein